LSLFIMLAEGVKLCLVLCFNLYLHHLPETPIEPKSFEFSFCRRQNENRYSRGSRGLQWYFDSQAI